jgi:hypothetical protein
MMRPLGWMKGKNISLEPRSANGNLMVLRPMALELAALGVDVIVTYGTDAALAAKSATTTIAIVMASAGDPVGTGLVASLARPGANHRIFDRLPGDRSQTRCVAARTIAGGAARLRADQSPHLEIPS